MVSKNFSADQKPKDTIFVYFSAFIASVGGVIFGYDIGIISGALLQLKEVFNLSAFQQELVVTGVLVGAFFASFFGGNIIDYWGRKTGIFVSCGLFTVGSLILCGSLSFLMLLIGRFIVGMAVSLSVTAECTYISEIAPPSVRGRMVSFNEVGITSGFLLAYLVNYLFISHSEGWKYMFGLAAIPAILQVIGVIFMPRSHHYLLVKGKPDEARKVLKKIRNTEDVEQEIVAIQTSIAEQQNRRYRDLFSKTMNMRARMILGMALVFLQQFSGNANVLYYAPIVFQHFGYGSDTSATLASVGLGVVKVIATVITVFIVDKVGRRSLLVCGTLLMAVSIIVLGIIGTVEHSHVHQETPSLNVLKLNDSDVTKEPIELSTNYASKDKRDSGDYDYDPIKEIYQTKTYGENTQINNFWENEKESLGEENIKYPTSLEWNVAKDEPNLYQAEAVDYLADSALNIATNGPNLYQEENMNFPIDSASNIAINGPNLYQEENINFPIHSASNIATNEPNLYKEENINFPIDSVSNIATNDPNLHQEQNRNVTIGFVSNIALNGPDSYQEENANVPIGSASNAATNGPNLYQEENTKVSIGTGVNVATNGPNLYQDQNILPALDSILSTSVSSASHIATKEPNSYKENKMSFPIDSASNFIIKESNLYAEKNTNFSINSEATTIGTINDHFHEPGNQTYSANSSSDAIKSQTKLNLEPVPLSTKIASLLSLMVFVCAYSMSYGPVTWLVLSEIFPGSLRGRAVSVATCVNWGSNIIVSLTFLDILDAIGIGPAFITYGFISLAASIFIFFCVPETKGKSLEEINGVLNEGFVVNNWKNIVPKKKQTYRLRHFKRPAVVKIINFEKKEEATQTEPKVKTSPV